MTTLPPTPPDTPESVDAKLARAAIAVADELEMRAVPADVGLRLAQLLPEAARYLRRYAARLRAPAVKVKPLEWRKREGSDALWAETPLGVYVVFPKGGSGGPSLPRGFDVMQASSVAEANDPDFRMRAFEAEHAARILSCLEISP